MLEQQNILINLLKEQVDKNQEFLYGHDDQLDSSIQENEDLVNHLVSDIKSIDSIDFQKIEKLIRSFTFDNDEAIDVMINEMSLIKEIITMNVEENTTVELESDELEAFDLFLNKVNEVINIQKEERASLQKRRDIVLGTTNKYVDLITMLTDPNNTSIIRDSSTLHLLFTKRKVSEKEKQRILVDLMKYNHEIFERQLKNIGIDESSSSEILIKNDVSQLFERYGYQFSLLDVDVQSYILKYGRLSRMEAIFQALNENNFSKIDEISKGKVLFALLISSSKEIIDSNTKLALEKGLQPDDLLQISNSLIKQSPYTKKEIEMFFSYAGSDSEHDLGISYGDDELLSLVKGASDDFSKNIALLESKGLMISVVFDKCKQLLVLSHELLRNNLSLFEKYGFSLMEKNMVVRPALTALMALNFADIADQFIEIHPLGIYYLRDNLSNLRSNVNPLDILFYNIYQASREQVDSNGKLVAAGPFVEVSDYHIVKLQLKGEITRFSKKYKYLPYCGITDLNKMEVTNTIYPVFDNQVEYDSIMKNVSSFEIDDSIFDHDYIKAINNYSDQNEPLAYNFSGIRISKLKVLRVFDTLLKNGVTPSIDSLMFAVTYHTIINQEDYDRLEMIIKGSIQGGVA